MSTGIKLTQKSDGVVLCDKQILEANHYSSCLKFNNFLKSLMCLTNKHETYIYMEIK